MPTASLAARQPLPSGRTATSRCRLATSMPTWHGAFGVVMSRPPCRPTLRNAGSRGPKQLSGLSEGSGAATPASCGLARPRRFTVCRARAAVCHN
jgi:hypothetical protein